LTGRLLQVLEGRFVVLLHSVALLAIQLQLQLSFFLSIFHAPTLSFLWRVQNVGGGTLA
jgi:nucleoside recognition membrane protein YjiH